MSREPIKGAKVRRNRGQLIRISDGAPFGERVFTLSGETKRESNCTYWECINEHGHPEWISAGRLVYIDD